MDLLTPRKPASPDELDALIKEAHARQLRRRLIGAAGAAVVAALGLSAYALAIGDGGHATPTGGSAGGGAPSCRTSQLATSAEGGPGDGWGKAGVFVQFVDTSGQACVLPTGVPTVTFALRGKTAPMEQQTLTPPYSAFGPRAGRGLVPGRKVMYVLEWRAVCPGPVVSEAKGTAVVMLRFRSGLRIAAPETTPEGFPIIPGCGGKPTTVGVTPLLRAPA